MAVNNEANEEKNEPIAPKASAAGINGFEVKVPVPSDLFGWSDTFSPINAQYMTQAIETLRQANEQNTAQIRQVMKQVREQNRLLGSVVVPKVLVPKIDLPRFELPVYSSQLSEILEELSETIAGIRESINKILSPEVFAAYRKLGKFLPENLAGLDDDVTLKQVLTLVRKDGIPLYVVPRSDIVRNLVYSDSASRRRDVLVECKELIFEDCRVVLNRISSEYALEKKFFILAGLNALENGHVEAAQALFTNTLDTVHQNFWGLNRQSRSVISNHAEGDELPELIKNMNFLDVFVFAPIWNSHMKFFGHEGQEPPSEYSRHASVHGVSRRQYKLENCIHALMLVTSLLVYVDENERTSES